MSADLEKCPRVDYLLGHGFSLPSLAAVPAVVLAAAVLGRMLASLAREMRLTFVAWLALRGTSPGERSQILQALAAIPRQPEGTVADQRIYGEADQWEHRPTGANLIGE